MERLQAAIAKARAHRDQSTTRARPSSAKPVSQHLRSQTETRWLELKELDLRPAHLLRQRMLAFKPSIEAAPYDVLRTRFIQQARTNAWRRVAIVSAHGASGKTTCVANLALGLARQREIHTIVMDFDLRRSGLSKALGQQGHVPIADMLEDRVPFSEVGRRHGTTLAFGLNFGSSPNSAEVLHSEMTEQVLHGIEQDYAPDFMIFDLPPLNVSDDSAAFLTRVDAALILAEAERTTMAQIDAAERRVAELTNVMGIVLNKCRYASGDYGPAEGYY